MIRRLLRTGMGWTFLLSIGCSGITSSTVSTGPGEPGIGPREMVEVRRVIDGDSLELASGEQVRLVGVNAPEWDEPFGPEARSYVQQTFSQGKAVILRRCLREERDRFNRLLAFLEVNEVDLQEELLRQGLALPMVIGLCGRIRVLPYETAAAEARRRTEGLWKSVLSQVVADTEANRLIGTYGGVRGRVRTVHETTRAVHLNFGANWRTDFTATIYREYVDGFHRRGETFGQEFVGREVIVYGYVRKYYGPQIILYSPVQVEVPQ